MDRNLARRLLILAPKWPVPPITRIFDVPTNCEYSPSGLAHLHLVSGAVVARARAVTEAQVAGAAIF